MIEVFELRVTILDEFEIYLGVGRRFAINPNARHLGIYDTNRETSLEDSPVDIGT